MKWVTKVPGKKALTTNLLRIFDMTSWTLTFVSMILLSCVLIAAYKLEHNFGGRKPDIVLLMLTPLAMLNAEAMPADNGTREKSRGKFLYEYLTSIDIVLRKHEILTLWKRKPVS